MEATQVVISKLKRIEDRDRFVALTLRMVDWLRGQPGFVDYALYENGREMSDMLVYESPRAAQDINDRFRETGIRREFADLVEPGHVGFMGRRVGLDPSGIDVPHSSDGEI